MVTHEDIHARMEAGQVRFEYVEAVLKEVKSGLATVISGQDEFRAAIKDIRADVSETKEIVEAYSAVKTMGKFMKWVGGLATALAAIWIVIKAGATVIIKGGL